MSVDPGLPFCLAFSVKHGHGTVLNFHGKNYLCLSLHMFHAFPMKQLPGQPTGSPRQQGPQAAATCGLTSVVF